MFTRLSVHCAERITETSNWYGFWYCNSLSATGMFCWNQSVMPRKRCRVVMGIGY